MKKIFRLTIIYAYCCIMALSIAACSKDDDNPSEPKVKMQLAGITITDPALSIYGQGTTTTFSNFVYDNQGRITSYDLDDYSGNQGTVTYEYQTASIIKRDDKGEKSTFNLTNGLISSQNKEDQYSYTNDNLTKWIEGDNYSSSTINYIWEGGNPIRETVHNGSHTTITNYNYSTLPCYIGNIQTFFDNFSRIQVELMGGSFFDPFLQQLGYYGNLPKNLILSTDDWELSYELNDNGYPTKIIAKDDSDTATMTLQWK